MTLTEKSDSESVTFFVVALSPLVSVMIVVIDPSNVRLFVLGNGLGSSVFLCCICYYITFYILDIKNFKCFYLDIDFIEFLIVLKIKVYGLTRSH